MSEHEPSPPILVLDDCPGEPPADRRLGPDAEVVWSKILSAAAYADLPAVYRDHECSAVIIDLRLPVGPGEVLLSVVRDGSGRRTLLIHAAAADLRLLQAAIEGQVPP